MRTKELTITRPSDFHLHFREGRLLSLTVPHTARHFHYALAMPNLFHPVVEVEQALIYREAILKALDMDEQNDHFKPSFHPLMAIYLRESTTSELVNKVAQSHQILGFKLYPQGVTTHSKSGVSDFENLYPVLEAMEKYEVPLMIHGEILALEAKEIDVFDCEKVFIDHVLTPILTKFPSLTITLEHITTQEGVSFIQSSPPWVKATITPHHLYLNRNDLLRDGIRPHYYCKPIVKRSEHQAALIKAATSGDDCFFLGSDSAPHSVAKKESACGCAGIYTAPIVMPLYAEVFFQNRALEHLENFSSVTGCKHYRLEIPQAKIRLRREQVSVPEQYQAGEEIFSPFKNGEKVEWKVMPVD